jgi:3-oxoacyl-(acyl-carrier-protein) synthase
MGDRRIKVNPVSILDARILTTLGNLNDTWESIIANHTGLQHYEDSFFPNNMPIGAVSDLEGNLGSNIRLQQLLDLILDETLILPDSTSIIISTTKGAVDELFKYPESTSWQNQPWNIGNYVNEKLGLVEPAVTISAACASGTMAIISAVMRILNGSQKFVLVIGIDLLSTFVTAGFNSLMAISQNTCKPFDRNRDGLALGEGVGYVLLGDSREAEKLNIPSMAQITGWGASCDATHITAPSRTADGLIDSINQATNNLKKKIGGINAHGTGTPYNDAMEIYAFNNLWEKPPPFHSVKGAIGHCLGAAGIIETAIAIKSLHEGVLPPTVGLENPEIKALNSIVYNNPRELNCSSILKCNSGFGGINVALLLEN